MEILTARLKLALINVSNRMGQLNKPWFAIASSENGHRERVKVVDQRQGPAAEQGNRSYKLNTSAHAGQWAVTQRKFSLHAISSCHAKSQRHTTPGRFPATSARNRIGLPIWYTQPPATCTMSDDRPAWCTPPTAVPGSLSFSIYKYIGHTVLAPTVSCTDIRYVISNGSTATD